MGKILSETERKLQRKLIPVNLIVCIICLAAVFSLVAMPFLKVDIGKILKSESMISFVENRVNKVIADNTDDESVEYAPVVGTIVTETLNSAEGEFTISGLDVVKVLLKKSENKPQAVISVIFTAEDSLLSALIERTASEVSALFGNADGLYETLVNALRASLNGLTSHSVEYLAKNVYVLVALLAFILPWVILFLFSFFHMCSKNKRFMMWYVKLYSFLPALLFFVAPKLVKVLGKFMPKLIGGNLWLAISGVLSGISSYAWISGICYLLLWFISIFWAFPIKHKIRKERKACKRGNKASKGNHAPAAYPENPYAGYGDNYGGDGYGYGNPYDSGYGGYSDYDGGFNEPYEGDYGDLYGDYGGYDDYGSGYGGYGGYDDDDYGSSYGGYGGYDDDDDY